MEALLHADYIAYNRSPDSRLRISAAPGEAIFLQGPRRLCDLHFEVLAGLRRPDRGDVRLDGVALSSLTGRSAAAFRRDRIGAIPRCGGLMPELPMMDQIALPMYLAGARERAVLEALRSRFPSLPLHRLYDPPVRSNARTRAWAAIARAVIRNPKLIVINGFFEEAEDPGALWEMLLDARPEESILVYLSSAPAPAQVRWTQQLPMKQEESKCTED